MKALASIYSAILAAILPALHGCSPICTGMQFPDPPAPEYDSLPIKLIPEQGIPIGCIDVFLFETSVQGRLLWHGTSLEFQTDSSEKTVCIVANSPYLFHTENIPSLSSLESATAYFEDDNPDFPLASACFNLNPATEGKVSFRFSPLMCSIDIVSITNNAEGYTRLENPRAYLLCANRYAEIFRTRGFFPVETLDTVSMTTLPCDIGVFTARTDVTLHCYPNEAASSINTTTLVLECEMRGVTTQFPLALPPLPRGSGLQLSLTVDSPSEFCWNSYRNQLTLLD